MHERRRGPYPGTSVAQVMSVLIRRITALLAMLAIVGLILLLMWDVYLHHSRAGAEDEPTSVAILGRVA